MGKVTPERHQRVVLAQVLPSEVNVGYESVRNVVIDKINGMKIRQISDVITALKSPVNGFNVFEFQTGESTKRAVLDATDIDHVNQEILSHYNIRYDHVLNSEAPARTVSAPVSAPTSPAVIAPMPTMSLTPTIPVKSPTP